MRRIGWRLRALAAVGGLAVLSAVSPTAAALGVEERNYLLAATAASRAQIEVNKIAVERARNQDVGALAERLLAFHRGSYARLTQAAQLRGVEPAREVDPIIRPWLEQLERLEGGRFDAVYVSGQVPALYTLGLAYKREMMHGSDELLQGGASRRLQDTEEQRREAHRLAVGLADDLPSGLHPVDKAFLLFGTSMHQSQIRLGELALAKAQDGRVREFARRMVDGGRPAYDEIAQAARARQVAPLTEVDPVARGMEARLEQLSGREFDWEYATSQVIHHYARHYRYEHVAIHGREAALRELARDRARARRKDHDAALAIVHHLERE